MKKPSGGGILYTSDPEPVPPEGRRTVTITKLPDPGRPQLPGARSATVTTVVTVPQQEAAARREEQRRRRVEVQRLGSAEAAAPSVQPASGTPVPSAPRRQDPCTGVEKGGSQERQDWVRQLLDGLWPYAREAAEKVAWAEVPKQLEASRPPFVYELRMDRFTLGDAQPVVRDIRVHRGDGGGLEQLYVEFEAEWHSQQDIAIQITVPRLPVAVAEVTPDVVEAALRLMMQLRVSLRDAWIRAGVRVTLCPLLHRVPVVGALQVGLTRVPDFGYELDLSLASAALVPLIKEWLDGALRDLVLQPWVLPEHYFFPLDPGVGDVERPAGILAVRVVGAEDVPQTGLFSKGSRCFVELSVRASQRRQTHVAPPGDRATWDSQFEFPVSVPEHQELTVVLYDYSDWAPNDELGRAQLALRDLPPGGQQDVVLLIKAGEEKQHEETKKKDDLTTAHRVAMALGRPFTKKSSAVCKLRLQVTYLALSERESQLIMQQRWQSLVGGAAPAAGPSGAQELHPLVHRMLHSGMLIVNVQRAEGMLHGKRGSLFKPYYKAVVRVGGGEKATDATQASRQGAVEFSRTVTMHLGADVVQDASAQVEIKLMEHGWTGGSRSCGTIVLPLQELVAGSKVEGLRPLQGGKGQAKLEVHYRPYF